MTSFGDADPTYWVRQFYKGYIIEVRAPKIRTGGFNTRCKDCAATDANARTPIATLTASPNDLETGESTVNPAHIEHGKHANDLDLRDRYDYDAGSTLVRPQSSTHHAFTATGPEGRRKPASGALGSSGKDRLAWKSVGRLS